MKKNKKNEIPSELRQDLVTGDWVIIATGRAKRPDDFVVTHKDIGSDRIEDCPFEDPIASGQEKDILVYETSDEEWSLRVFPNKYPALVRGRIPQVISEGPYKAFTGVGYHELVVTRDHDKHIALLAVEQVAEIFDAYQDRYMDLMRRRSVKYIGIIHNHGKKAGASIAHPHSQIFAIPVISPYIRLELEGADRYRKGNRTCAFCEMIHYERMTKTRVVFENEAFIAMCPFASRSAFEMWVLPKNHSPYFERITNEEKISLAEVFQKALYALFSALGNPDYNFYIHTSPCDGRDYSYFHWHIEILPNTATWAGFELSTGVEISTIEPEVAAKFLRKNLNG
jgi:UDPglucose--hexose-1-phosphate uridylyltransferase